MYATSLNTPIGTLWLTASDVGLCSIDFTNSGHPESGARHFASTVSQLQEYFAGKRHDFDLALDLSGTKFQDAVWKQMRKVGYGSTSTYADLAKAIAKPRAVRAVGSCCARNPIPFVIPCHRILGSNGKLTGYRGGLAVKQHLLELEGCL